jgi:hypothetical protein
MPLLALDQLASIEPVRIDASLPFSALLTLWLSNNATPQEVVAAPAQLECRPCRANDGTTGATIMKHPTWEQRAIGLNWESTRADVYWVLAGMPVPTETIVFAVFDWIWGIATSTERLSPEARKLLHSVVSEEEVKAHWEELDRRMEAQEAAQTKP